MSVLEEVLRMVLEIINSALSHQLVYCPNLVYTLLYKRHVFESFRSHPAFQDIIQNIDMVIGFFTSRLQRVQGASLIFILQHFFQLHFQTNAVNSALRRSTKSSAKARVNGAPIDCGSLLIFVSNTSTKMETKNPIFCLTFIHSQAKV